MDIRQIRRIKTLELIKQKGISKAEFSRLLGKSPQQMNELLREKNPKNIGHNIARLIESTFEKESGWLDKEDENTPALESDNSAEALYRRASSAATEFIRARKLWMDSRTAAIRAIEDHFRAWLANASVELLPPTGRYDYSITSHITGQSSVNLFTPLPGFSSWKIPEFDDEQPDFLAITLMAEKESGSIGYFILSRPEYLRIAKDIGTTFLDLSHSGAFTSGEFVYIKLSCPDGTRKHFQGFAKDMIQKLLHKPTMGELQLKDS